MKVDVDGAKLYVEVAGDGPPLLSINGSGAALTDGTGPSASPLSEHFTVAAYDHRGLGRSTCRDRVLTMTDFAADGFAVADALGWKQFAVLGPSFGGMVALEMAVSQPARISRLVLCCTSSGGAGGSSYPLHERPDPMSFLAIIDSRPEAQSELAPFFSGGVVASEPGYERQLQARRGHDVWERLPLIMATTLVTSGRYDGIAPPENGEAIASRITGARYEVFEGGHLFMYQDDRAWPVIIDFLRGAGLAVQRLSELLLHHGGTERPSRRSLSHSQAAYASTCRSTALPD